MSERKHLDGRTRWAKRLKVLEQEFIAASGATSVIALGMCRRAAGLTVQAERHEEHLAKGGQITSRTAESYSFINGQLLRVMRALGIEKQDAKPEAEPAAPAPNLQALIDVRLELSPDLTERLLSGTYTEDDKQWLKQSVEDAAIADGPDALPRTIEQLTDAELAALLAVMDSAAPALADAPARLSDEHRAERFFDSVRQCRLPSRPDEAVPGGRRVYPPHEGPAWCWQADRPWPDTVADFAKGAARTTTVAGIAHAAEQAADHIAEMAAITRRLEAACDANPLPPPDDHPTRPPVRYETNDTDDIQRHWHTVESWSRDANRLGRW